MARERLWWAPWTGPTNGRRVSRVMSYLVPGFPAGTHPEVSCGHSSPSLSSPSGLPTVGGERAHSWCFAVTTRETYERPASRSVRSPVARLNTGALLGPTSTGPPNSVHFPDSVCGALALLRADRPGHVHTQPGARRPGRARSGRASGMANGACTPVAAGMAPRVEVTDSSGVIPGAERMHALSNRRGAAASETTAAASQPRVEQVPHGITQHVETVHHDRQAHPGP